MPHDKAIQIARQLCAAVSRGARARRAASRPEAGQRDDRRRRRRPHHRLRPRDGDGRRGSGAGGHAAVHGAGAAGGPARRRRRATSTRSVWSSSRSSPASARYDAKTLGELKQLHDTGTVDDALVARAGSGSGGRARDPAVSREGSAAAAGVGARRWPPRCRAAIRWRRRWRPARRRRPTCSPRPAKRKRSASDGAWRRSLPCRRIAGVRRIVRRGRRSSAGCRSTRDRRPDQSRGADDRIARLPRQAGRSSFWFLAGRRLLGWLWRTRSGPTRWDSIAIGNPSAVLFWYRTSPREMVPIVPAPCATERSAARPDRHAAADPGRPGTASGIPSRAAASRRDRRSSRGAAMGRSIRGGRATDVRVHAGRADPGCLAITLTHERHGKVRCRNSLTSGCGSRPPDIAGSRCGSRSSDHGPDRP